MPKKTTTQPAATAAPILATAPSPMPNAQFQDAIDAFKAFKPNTTRWSEFNALALAHASNLAYKDEATIRSVAPSCGFNKVSVVAKSKQMRFSDYGLKWEVSNKTGFFSPFSYQSA